MLRLQLQGQKVGSSGTSSALQGAAVGRYGKTSGVISSYARYKKTCTSLSAATCQGEHGQLWCKWRETCIAKGHCFSSLHLVVYLR